MTTLKPGSVYKPAHSNKIFGSERFVCSRVLSSTIAEFRMPNGKLETKHISTVVEVKDNAEFMKWVMYVAVVLIIILICTVKFWLPVHHTKPIVEYRSCPEHDYQNEKL